MDMAKMERFYGTKEVPPTVRSFYASDFEFLVQSGQIVGVFWRGIEILRGINYLLRDADWATPSAEYVVEKGEGEVGDSFLHVEGRIRAREIAYDYTMNVRSREEHQIVIETTGKALSSFCANRVGLTLLHPTPDCVGRSLDVIHSDGGQESVRFPELISPSQPVFDIVSLSYELADGSQMLVRMNSHRPSGEEQTFEMEDQRNWGDASYKTYVGSLRDPWPFSVEEGDEFHQSITLSIVPKLKTDVEVGVGDVREESEFRCPLMYLAVPFGGAVRGLENVLRFGCFSSDGLKVYLKTHQLDSQELEAIRGLQQELGCPLHMELEVHGDVRSALEHVKRECLRYDLEFKSVLACQSEYLLSYQPDGIWPDIMALEDFYCQVRHHFPESEIGGGMLTYFPELNRKWPPGEVIDFVAHAYCPIIHAADDKTIMQNIKTLGDMRRTVFSRLPGVPYDLTHVSLSMRQNPYGTSLQENPERKRLPMSKEDPRERGIFGALWMLKVLDELAMNDVRSVGIGALSGSSSIFDERNEGGKRPTYYVLEQTISERPSSSEYFQEVGAELCGSLGERGE
jgi:hypothetical protein